LTAIAFDRVTLSIGGKTILSDITLDVGEGEFIGVLGANGAGKTTLMKAILGLLPLASGTIRVLGRQATRGNPAIGYLPQSHAAPAGLRLSGRDFLAASIRGHRFGMPIVSAADGREIDRCLDMVGARQLAGRALADMSGGERQRLLIAEALIGAPRALILDEPLISLDPHQQRIVVDLVQKLSRELNLTVLFSAHELNQLLGAIDRVLYLGHGQAALGTVDAVITPETLSRLYGAPIEVVRAAGKIFVMSGGQVVERDQHHDHDHAH
jgi:zinc/manganese transport system ATP-binding protein